MSTEIINYIDLHQNALLMLRDTCIAKIEGAIKIIISTLANNNKLLIAGNGGSAADSEHFTAELIGSYLERKRKPLPCISLSSNTSTLTAVSNDYSYANVFSRQLEALAKNGDCLVLISTSGKSENIVEAYKTAIKLNLDVILITSLKNNLPIYKKAHIIDVPSKDTPIIQELHILIIHLICNSIDKYFFNME